MIRVLHVFGDLGTGGTENLIMNWYRNIDRTKVQFDFLVRSKAKNFVEEIHELGGNIYYTAEFPRHALKNYFETKRVLSKKNWDVIHVHGNALIYMTALVLAKRYKIPTRIMHSHSVQSKKSIYSVIHYSNRFFLDRYANVKLACSSKAGEWMFGKKEFYVLKNGLSIEKYLFSQNDRDEVRKELGLNNKFVIGHVGRFTKVKNHEYLISVFEELLKIHKNSALLLVGDGELKKGIEEEVCKRGLQKSVIFTGVREDVGKLLSAMDIFVFPSTFEGLGNVLVEAQINGLRCLANENVITEEVCISKNMEGLSLQAPPAKWAEYIVVKESSIDKRYLNHVEIQKSGYDINEIVLNLQKIYERK